MMSLSKHAIRVLEGMKQGLRDERPKNVVKLKNVLRKERKVLYVSSVLSTLLNYKDTVHICHVDEIYSEDKQLDNDIAKLVLEHAKTNGRTVFVLPCDSNFHLVVGDQLKEWYVNKIIPTVDTLDPLKQLGPFAQACSVEAELDTSSLIAELERIGYIRIKNASVTYTFPEQRVIEILKAVWDKYQVKIREDLGVVSSKSYQIFESLIMESNAAIQKDVVDKTGAYSEHQFKKRHSLFKKQVSTTEAAEGKLKQLSMNEMDTSTADPETMEDDENKLEELPSTIFNLLPIGIQPDVAYVIISLYGLEPKPSSTFELGQFLESISKVTYVVSPKYFLAEVKKDKNTSDSFENFKINLHIAHKLDKMNVSLKDETHKLASLLSFPGKDKRSTGPRRVIPRKQIYLKQYSMDTSEDTAKETLQNFQKFIISNGQTIAQKHRSIVILSNDEAQKRCDERITTWLNGFRASNDVVKEEDFSNQLIKLSYEEGFFPEDTLVEVLINVGYLETKLDVSTNPTTETVVYKTDYSRLTEINDTSERTDEQKFLASWEPFYRRSYPKVESQVAVKPDKEETSRKRAADETDVFAAHKRSKIINI